MGDFKKLRVRIGEDSREFYQGMNRVEQRIGRFGNNVNKLGGLIAGAFSVSVVANFAKEVSNLAGEAEGVRMAFFRIADENYLEELKKSVRGTVSEVELMKKTVLATNLGMPIENFARLLEFASRRAQETGESVEYLVESLVRGVGLKSTRVLDNLGISATRLKEKIGDVGLETAAVGDVARAVAEIAEEEFAKMGDAVITSKDKTEQLNAQWENTKVLIGNAANSVKDELIPAISETLDGLSEVIKALQNISKEETGNTAKFKDVAIQIGKIVKNTAVIKGLYDYNKLVLGKIVDLSKQYNEETEGTTGNIFDISKATKEIIQNNEKWAATGTKLDEMFKKINEHVQDIQSGIGLIGWKEGEIKALEEKIKASKSREEIFKLNQELVLLKRELEGLKTAGIEELVKIKPLTPILDSVKTEAELVDEAIAKATENYQKNGSTITETNLMMDQSMDDLANTAKNMAMSFEGNMGDALKATLNYTKSTIAAIVAEGVARAMLGELISKPLIGTLTAGAVGLLTKGLFNSVIPSFANEGMVDRPTLAMVGDYPGVSSNREFMLKESTLKNLQGNTNVTVDITGALSGENIYFAAKNYTQRRSKMIKL